MGYLYPNWGGLGLPLPQPGVSQHHQEDLGRGGVSQPWLGWPCPVSPPSPSPHAGTGGVTLFPAGLDLVEMGGELLLVEGEDVARKAWNLRRKIRHYQETFSVLEKVGRGKGGGTQKGHTHRSPNTPPPPRHRPPVSPAVPQAGDRGGARRLRGRG